MEALLRMCAQSPRVYFKDSGNVFDFVIVLISIVSSVISLSHVINLGAATTFIRALRISRIFKFIQKAQKLSLIFDTIVVTMPAMTNIGGLMLLFLYLYAVLGV